MNYTLLLERHDDRGPDALSTLKLTVERNSPPERIADFAGGSGCLSNGYSGKDSQLQIVADEGFFGVALRRTEDGHLLIIESCDNPLRDGGLLELKADHCSYRMKKLSSGSP